MERDSAVNGAGRLAQARCKGAGRLSGDSLLFSLGAALGPIPRASVPSPAYLMWPVPPGVSVGATDTTVLGFYFGLTGAVPSLLGSERAAHRDDISA